MSSAQLAAQRDDLRAKQRTYDARLLQIPEVEREYSELTRDYSNAQTRYREIKAKQLQAEGAMELEKDSKAERFSLGEPADLPQKPFSPNRPAIIADRAVRVARRRSRPRVVARDVRPVRQGSAGARSHRPGPDSDGDPLHRDRVANGRADGDGRSCSSGRASAVVVFLLAGVHYFMKPIPQIVASVMHKIAVW